MPIIEFRMTSPTNQEEVKSSYLRAADIITELLNALTPEQLEMIGEQLLNITIQTPDFATVDEEGCVAKIC